MNVFFQTGRLRLRRFATADVDNLVALDSDPEVMRYLTNGKPTPREPDDVLALHTDPGSRSTEEFKLAESAQTRWQGVNAPHLIDLVRAGAHF